MGNILNADVVYVFVCDSYDMYNMELMNPESLPSVGEYMW